MSDRPVEIRISTAADTSGAEAARQAIEGVQEASAEASAASQAEAVVQQEQGREIVTGFGGQVEAMERIAEARRAAERDLRAQQEAQRQLNEETEDYEENLEDVAEQERRLQRERDVEEATRRRDARAAGADDGGGGGILGNVGGLGAIIAAAAAIGKTAQFAYTAVAETLREMVALKEEAGAGLTFMDAYMVSVADTIDMLTSPVESLKSALQSIAGLDGLRDSIAQSKEMEERLAAMLEIRKQLAAQQQEFERAFASQRERIEIDNQTAAMERQLKVLGARRALLDAQGSRQDAAAIAGGADPNAVAAQALARQTASEIEALNEELMRSAQSVERAKAEVGIVTDQLVEAMVSGNLESANTARLALQENENALDEAVADHRATVESLRLQEAVIKEQATAESEQLQQDVGASITASLQDLAADLEATAAEQGGQLSSSARAGYEKILELIRDSIPDEQQIPQIEQAMALVKASQEGLGREVLGGISELTMVTATQAQEMRRIRSDIRALQLRRDPRPGP